MTNWRGWTITDEQAEQIRNGDKVARDKFYFDNLPRIRKMAFSYAKKNPRCSGFVNDMIQGLYVDLADFRQDNGRVVVDGKTLSGFVYSSFRNAPYGGLLYLRKNNPKILSGRATYTCLPLSLDAPIGGAGRSSRYQDDDDVHTLADILPAPDDSLFGAVDLTDDLKELCAPLLSARLFEAFGWFIEGYGGAEIAHKMGCRQVNIDSMKRQLRAHVSEILSGLDALGVPVEHLNGVSPYDAKSDRTYKMSAEQRARHAESMRRQRARKRTSPNDLPPVA